MVHSLRHHEVQEPELKGRTPDLDTNSKEDTPVPSVPALTDLTVADLWKELKDEATLLVVCQVPSSPDVDRLRP